MNKDFYFSLGYIFKDISLLETALTHKSIHSESNATTQDYERLEFIGDALLDSIIGIELYKRLKDANEGELTKKRASIVCENSLSIVAKKMDLGNNMRFGHQAIINNVYQKDSILADCLEAIIGAIYLDSNYDEVSKFVLDKFEFLIEASINNSLFSDYKSELQEYFQKKSKNLDLRYVVDKEDGPDHNKTFFIHVERDNKVLGKGIGKTKKEAEQDAAKSSFINLGKDNI